MHAFSVRLLSAENCSIGGTKRGGSLCDGPGRTAGHRRSRRRPRAVARERLQSFQQPSREERPACMLELILRRKVRAISVRFSL
jgi:hypothetical protein